MYLKNHIRKINEDIKIIMEKNIVIIRNIELFANIGIILGGVSFLSYFGNGDFLFNCFITTYGGFIGGISGVTIRAIFG
jgi:hypothetical protein